MDENVTTEVMSTDSVIEANVISHSNPVLTLITTEDGIPTSTEVTVLTTALGDVPLMTATLGTLSEVPLVSAHPTFVTTHSDVNTVYTTSIIPSVGEHLIVGEGQIAVLEAEGNQQTIVVHTDSSQLSSFTEVHDNVEETQIVTYHQNVPPSEEIEVDSTLITTENNQETLENPKDSGSVQDALLGSVNNNPGAVFPVSNSGADLQDNDNSATTAATQDQEYLTTDNITQFETPNFKDEAVTSLESGNSAGCLEVVPLSSPKPIPKELICLLCYQSFINPNCGNIEVSSEVDNVEIETAAAATTDENGIKEIENVKKSYGRTLGKFFEISRINMSIVTRRSYKDYELPICQSCDKRLVEAEVILEELRRLERELYYVRQRMKDEILNSHDFFKNEQNIELAESRKLIPGLKDIIDVIDRIRHDIIHDGRPPKLPRSIGSSGKSSRKSKQRANTEVGEEISNPENSVDVQAIPAEKAGNDEAPAEPANAEMEKSGPSENSKESQEDNKDDSKINVPAVRTSFGRLIKRPTYMVNELTDDELSELDESSEDNYEEIEVKPELPVTSEQCLNNDEEMDEEDPAWSPGRGMLISERVGIPATSSDESNYSEEDSEKESTSKVKHKREPKCKSNRKSKQTRKRARRVPAMKQEDMNYEVKVIQLDGTELMTINTSGTDNKIGLQPDITQKVMDSQAVIMVKNQLFGKRVQCPHCSRTFTDPSRRDVHVKKKHEGVSKPFECDVCEKRFSRQDHLKNHMKRHLRPAKEKMFKSNKPHNTDKNQACEYCEQRFRNKSELSVHIRTHTGERPYRCEHCTDSFVSALKREFHIEQMHPEIPPLRCDFCPKGFYRQHRLRIHAVSHTGEKTNICELCGKSFSQAAMLRYHQTTHEELNLKQFKCQECNRVFANPQNLKSHMESQHQKMYRHRCPHCDKGYTQMSHLRRHLRTHTGDQPFACRTCPKRFTSGAALKIHERIHTGERPYFCSLCEKGFRSKTKLGRHLKTLIHSTENKDKIKKETVTNELETADLNSAPTTQWTEIVGIITGV